MSRRRVLAALTVAVAAVTLVACGPDHSPRARSVDGNLQFAVCVPIEASRVELLVGPDGQDPYDFPPVWVRDGSHVFDAASVLVVGAAPEGMDATGDPSEVDVDTDRIAVRIVSDRPGQDTQVSEWKAGAISDSAWSNGADEKPCAA